MIDITSLGESEIASNHFNKTIHGDLESLLI